MVKSCENCKYYDKYAWCKTCDFKEKENKYKWHDLRKDPDDLPNAPEVLVAEAFKCGDKVDYLYRLLYYGKPCTYPKTKRKVFYDYDSEYGDYEVDNVVAWAYIPKFESEED